MNRRSFIANAAGLLVAPWVVKAANIMPVRPIATPQTGMEMMIGRWEGMRFIETDRYTEEAVAALVRCKAQLDAAILAQCGVARQLRVYAELVRPKLFHVKQGGKESAASP